MIKRCIVPLVCAAALFLNPATSVAQQSQPQQQQPIQQKAAPPERPDEILVVGRLDAGNPPVKTEQTPVIGQAGRALSSEAERFSRCAKLPSRDDLHQIVDRGPADFVAEGALHDYIARNQGCYIGYPGPPTPPSPFFGDCNPHLDGDMMICRAVYDRGAIFERVLKNIGDPLVSAAQLKIDEPTLARFLLRQEGRGKQSVSADRRYFGVVACMVGINPIAIRAHYGRGFHHPAGQAYGIADAADAGHGPGGAF